MPLTLRPTGLSSPAYRDWLDYVIVEDGRDVGRLYEDRHSKPELRWFWSITVYVDPRLGIITSGRAPSLDEAKAQFLGKLAENPTLTQLFPARFLLKHHGRRFCVPCRRDLLCRVMDQQPKAKMQLRRGWVSLLR